MSLRSMLKNLLVSEELEAHVDAMKKPVGELGYDPWGFNIETGKVSLGAFKLFYDHYFRVEAHGLENIPKQGRMLVIPNHSGQLPLDALLIGTALIINDHGPRAAGHGGAVSAHRAVFRQHDQSVGRGGG